MTSTNYYTGGKRGTFDGAPIWRPKWWGELGNDAEFREATRPRTAFKAEYYDGGYRKIIDGVPVRLASQVADWSPWMKAALGKGTEDRKEGALVEKQAEVLFPAFGREQALKRAEGQATCLRCKEQYYAGDDRDCWRHVDSKTSAADRNIVRAA